SLDGSAADALVERLEPVSLRPGVLATTFALALLLAGSVSAQDDSHVRSAERMYRDGDYAAAAQEFAVAAERPGADRRLFYNLGNSLYRDGRLAAALVAYERARLAMPRDPELLANIAVVERKLELARGEGEPFLDAVASVRDRFTAVERLWGAVLTNVLAAIALVFGSRAVRWIGVVLLVPAILLALEVVWFGPARLPDAIVLPPQVGVVAEPRDGLEPVLKLRRGVRVEVLGQSEAWSSVRANGRQGYVPTESIGVIR
ncbi:MAG: hypothetical protein KDB80_17270, partial [Planctomycetes bacterium]|nr:hypothetical protein [Planctomycetota bacterium]